MKFMTLILLTFVIIAISSPILIRATAPAPAPGAGEVPPPCFPMDLLPCLPALTVGEDPSTNCCNNMKEQQSCLCGYIKNPSYSMYIISIRTRIVLDSCKIPC